VSTGQETRYYFFGAQRVAMRQAGVLYWLLGDHLRSTSLTLNSSGTKTGELRYKAYGETRYTWGTTPTDHRFTDQLQVQSLGVYSMGARWYDPYLARWLSADTLVPDPANPQSLNRYSYGYNNPVKFWDPDGHFAWIPIALAGGLIGGAIYGYGTQVASNLQHGLDLGQALTTNIDPGTVALYAGAGAVIGTGLGVVAAGGAALISAASTTAGALCQDGDCTNEGASALKLGEKAYQAILSDGDPTNELRALQRTGQVLLDSGSKPEFRSTLRAGVEGLTSGQTKGVLEVLGKGQMERVTVSALENGQVQVMTQVPGSHSGFAQYLYVLDPSGKVIQLVQYGYNAAGELIHVHDKLP
jgi:RHS repeat-associated protein